MAAFCRSCWREVRTLHSRPSDSSMEQEAAVVRANAHPLCYLCNSFGDVLYRDLTDAVFFAPGKWSIRRCPNPACGLLWLDPMPVAEDLPAAYEGYYTHGEE